MTIYEIVAAHIREHDYDGLFNSDNECACLLEDLIPCGKNFEADDIRDCEMGWCSECHCRDEVHRYHVSSRSNTTRIDASNYHAAEARDEDRREREGRDIEGGTDEPIPRARQVASRR